MSYPDVVYKAHGMGNDFVIFADFNDEFEIRASEVRTLCNRRFGIGADGVIRFAQKTDERGVTRYFMDYLNSDGSLAQMCGNGARVCAAFAEASGLFDFSNGEIMELATRAGVKRLVKTRQNEWAVDIGKWEADSLPKFTVFLKDSSTAWTGRFVDLGNEHIVVNISAGQNAKTGVTLEDLVLHQNPQMSPSASALVPGESDVRVKDYGANYEFTEVDRDKRRIRMRVFERGVGETLSCGTGICASAISAYLDAREEGLNPQEYSAWTVEVPGGRAKVDITDDTVVLTGPAHMVAKIRPFPDLDMASLFAHEDMMGEASITADLAPRD